MRLSRRIVLGSLGLLAVGAVPRGVVAQATLRGFVRTAKGAEIQSAEVVLRPSDRRARTGADGRFTIGEIAPGTYVVTVRAIGYQPIEADAELAGHDTLDVTFELTPAVQVLESVAVTAPAPTPVVAKMIAFEERRKAGFGKFLTRADFERREHSPLSEVLRMVAGLVFIRRPYECGDGYAAASGRSGMLKAEAWMTCGGKWPMKPACYLSVYLDGVRIWTWGQDEIPDLDKIMPLAMLEGIEIYRGASELPTQYQTTGSACGALLLWTRN